MRTTWRDGGRDMAVTAPVSLIVTAFAPVADVRRALTPLLRRDCGDTELLWIDLGAGKRRLGGSALAQVYGQLGDVAPDLDDPARLVAFFAAIQALPPRAGCSPITTSATADSSRRCARWRSRRGAASTSRSMPSARSAGDCCSPRNWAPSCRCAPPTRAAVVERLAAAGLSVHAIGAPAAHDRIRIGAHGETLLDASRVDLHRAWSATTHALQRLRDNPESADQEYARLSTMRRSGSVAGADVRSGGGHRRAVHRDGSAAARSRSCASRASTARSRWRRRSIAPASRRSTCT